MFAKLLPTGVDGSGARLYPNAFVSLYEMTAHFRKVWLYPDPCSSHPDFLLLVDDPIMADIRAVRRCNAIRLGTVRVKHYLVS